MPTSARVLVCLLLPAIVGCGITPPAPRAGSDAPSDGQPPGPPKTITLGQLNITRSYGPWDFSNTTGGGSSLAEIHTTSLVTDGVESGLEPRLAAKLPSLADRTIVLLPDGRMEVTWQLRTGVKWHDGTPFTADDIVFSWQVETHPELAAASTSNLRHIENMEARDPHTVLMTFKTPYYRALDLGHRVLWPFPKHLLGESFANLRETNAFLAQPYFTSEYVNLGPFRLVENLLGDTQVFERFDGFFLGRPKVDRIVIRTVPDANVLFASLKAGAIDITADRTLPSDLFPQVRDEWSRLGEGSVHHRQDNWWYITVQFGSPWAAPPEVPQDVRIRRGLLLGLDRSGLREFLFPGFADTSGDTFMSQKDARAPAVGQPFARYPYDSTRAAQEFADAGWSRAADGRLLNRAGDQPQLELRASEVNAKEQAIIADSWRRLGLDVVQHTIPAARNTDREYRATFPGAEITARGSGDQVLMYHDGRLHAGPQNRWQGANTSHYANGALDRLIDRLYSTIDDREQGLILKEAADILAADLPALPTYFRVTFVAVARGVQALAADYAGSGGVGVMSRNAHRWDRA